MVTNSSQLTVNDARVSSESHATGKVLALPGNRPGEHTGFLQQIPINDLLTKLITLTGKKSFLVYKGNKYINVQTENIAFFYIKNVTAVIRCFDNQEYLLNYSLDQLQSLVSGYQFYRINRQYLVNFNAVGEVEHYFSRKMLVNPVIPVKDKLVVSREKVSDFLQWLDNR